MGDITLPDTVLQRYDIGQVRAVLPWGGTAGKTWRIDAAGGQYLLRLRGLRTSGEARLAFDHGLRTYLVQSGVPTVEAIRTLDGERWCRHEARVYELYPFVTGLAYDARARAQTAAAAQALAHYHLVARTYPAANQWHERVGQYRALGLSTADSTRLDDPSLLAAIMRALWGGAQDADARGLLERCLVRVSSLVAAYAGRAYERVAGWVIHGDYTPANLLFSERGAVQGIFDLDWAMPGARCRDLADGMYFFGSQRAWHGGADIWALTEAADWDPEGARTFLRGYTALAPLSDHEYRALPAAFAARWLSIRLEGMAKVAPTQRWRFFARDLERPLEWLDANGEALLN